MNVNFIKMIGPYLQAVEAQMAWRRSVELDVRPKSISPASWDKIVREAGLNDDGGPATRSHIFKLLGEADPYYMDKHFVDMVSHAVTEMPDSLCFEKTWFQSLSGFCFIETDAYTSDRFSKRIILQSMLWKVIDDKQAEINMVHSTMLGDKGERVLIVNQGTIVFGLPFSKVTFGPAASVVEDSIYPSSKWMYCAFYLMAQRLTVVTKQRVDRAVRRRAKQESDVPEIVRIVTLRRLEEDRERERAVSNQVDWHWRWSVRGHWRNQFFPSENTHKPVFIESYIKGPEDKPFKSGLKLFAANR